MRALMVPAGAALLVVGGSAGPTSAQTGAPALTLTSTTSSVAQGALAELSGRLTGVTGPRVIVIQRRVASGAFADSKRVSTDFIGAFDTTLAPPVTSDFRVVFNGLASPVVTVVVRDASASAGPAGSAGAAGPAGAVEAAGPAGLTGAVGATGPVGPAGAPGAAGQQGPAGDTGPAGQDGTSGLTSTAVVKVLTFQVAIADCPDGTVLTGGGGRSNSGLAGTFPSDPSGEEVVSGPANSWTAVSAGADMVAAWAVCPSPPVG